MFEKESEEYAKPFYDMTRYDYVAERTHIKKAFQAGAEFGYNKALEQCAEKFAESNRKWQEVLDKANEWHYPSKGQLPKVKIWVLGFYYGKDNWHKIFYRADGTWWGEGQLCQPPYAWKEIVLPKESE